MREAMVVVRCQFSLCLSEALSGGVVGQGGALYMYSSCVRGSFRVIFEAWQISVLDMMACVTHLSREHRYIKDVKDWEAAR
jgi:hypothetical protein